MFCGIDIFILQGVRVCTSQRAHGSSIFEPPQILRHLFSVVWLTTRAAASLLAHTSLFSVVAVFHNTIRENPSLSPLFLGRSSYRLTSVCALCLFEVPRSFLSVVFRAMYSQYSHSVLLATSRAVPRFADWMCYILMNNPRTANLETKPDLVRCEIVAFLRKLEKWGRTCMHTCLCIWISSWVSAYLFKCLDS